MKKKGKIILTVVLVLAIAAVAGGGGLPPPAGVGPVGHLRGAAGELLAGGAQPGMGGLPAHHAHPRAGPGDSGPAGGV